MSLVQVGYVIACSGGIMAAIGVLILVIGILHEG
jgi:hypothetical protein